MTGPLGDLERANYPMDPASLRKRRFLIMGSWLLLSVWEAVPIYLAFMKHSDNPSPEVATALAASLCWLPVIGTAAAVMASVWAWGVAWWMAVALYLGPKVVLLFAIRTIVRRSVKP